MYPTPFYIFLFIHVVSLIVGFGAVIVIDTFGLLMLLKRVPLQMPQKVANITQPLIWLGWTGLVVSGIFLLNIKGAISGITVLKLFFVIMLGLNGIFLHFIKKALDSFQSLEQIPNIWKFRIGLASLISQTGWWGALIIGFLNRHLGKSAPKIHDPLPWLLAFAFGFLIIAIIGEKVFQKKN